MKRSNLMIQFAASATRASTDMNRDIGFAPDNMAYGKSARTYVHCSGFKPRVLEPDASRYLAQLGLVADRILDCEGTWSEDTRIPVGGVLDATA